MTKTEKAQLAEYKKSNKERKLKLLVKWGYKSHETYFKAMNVPVKGAVKTTNKVVKPLPIKVKVVKSGKGKATDYVVAFDTTGSMNSYISSVRSHVVKLIGDLFDNSPNLRMKIVAFGDYCDMETSKIFGKAYQETELTDDRQALVDFVKNAKSTSGGDGDEFYELVIKKINEETKWRNGNRAVLLIADDEPHAPGYKYGGITHQISWRVEAANAKKLGIQYDTLKINKFTKWYGELSNITGGVSLDFQSAGKMSDIIEGTVLTRSSPSAFYAKSMKVSASGDAELIGAYKSMSTLLTDDDK